MSDTQISLDLNDTMKEAMAAGVIKWLRDQDALDQVLSQAFRHLLEPQKDNYGRASDKSRLQTAFENAATGVAATVAAQMLKESDDFQAKVREGIRQQLVELVADEERFKNVLREAVAAYWKS